MSLGRMLLVLGLGLALGSARSGQEIGRRKGSDTGAARVLPALDHEPRIGVLLARDSRLRLSLEAPAWLVVEGERGQGGPQRVRLSSGPLEVSLAPGTPGGWRLRRDERVRRGPARLQAVEGTSMRSPVEVQAIPVFGDPRTLRVAGELEFTVVDGQLELVEHLGLERYLIGVVGAEMNPRWPSAALEAQAIAARSYAAARWLERSENSWQLHWHFGVDMAYHGLVEGMEPVARAVEATRGKLLSYRGLPVLALFHASSGGRTEAFDRIKPGVLGPDGKTAIAAAMPVRDDPAAVPGALGLGLSDSHGRWKADVPLPEVTEALQEWSAKAEGRPQIGTVEAISTLERHADSKRVARVSIRHRLDGRERFTALDGNDFRLAVDPVRIRSLFWDRCVIAAREPGYLVLEGRGFGHGCGLSQVSAWHLAREGEDAEGIVARFYAGARIERRY